MIAPAPLVRGEVTVFPVTDSSIVGHMQKHKALECMKRNATQRKTGKSAVTNHEIHTFNGNNK